MISRYGDHLIFLAGPPRSGTTLLSVMLANSSEIWAPPEPWVALAMSRLAEPPTADLDQHGDEFLMRLALSETLPGDELHGMVREILHSLYNWLLQKKPGASFLLDKTPRYYKILDFLAQVLPQSRFVLMCRNPLDIAASHKTRWGMNLCELADQPTGSDTALDIYCAPRVIVEASGRLGDRAHLLRYEDLVANPLDVAANAFSFVGVPFSPAYLEYWQNESLSDIHRSSVLGDKEIWRRHGIDTSSVGRWRNELTNTEIDRVASVVGRDVFDSLGYDVPTTIPDDAQTRERLFADLYSSLRRTPDAVLSSTDPPESELTSPPQPLISIITPSFNQGRWIEEAIRSVLEQDYTNFEHIIIDADSSDQTAEVVARYPHVRFVREPDLGQAHAINKGILLSRGDILAYLNSDDFYLPGAFQIAAKELASPEAALALVGGCDRTDSEGHVIGRLEPRLESLAGLLEHWSWEEKYCIPQPAVFLRRELLAEVGLFNIKYQYVMDYDMWVRVASRHKFKLVDDTLAAFRFHDDSKTVAQAEGMYVEHRVAARRYWPSWWRPRRWYLEIVSLHGVGTNLLDVAEHAALSRDPRRGPLKLLGQAIHHFPPLALCPRSVLTLLTGLTADRPFGRKIADAHRYYLGVRWHVKHRLLGA